MTWLWIPSGPADVLQQQSNAVRSLSALEEVQWFCFCVFVNNSIQIIIIIRNTNRWKKKEASVLAVPAWYIMTVPPTEMPDMEGSLHLFDIWTSTPANILIMFHHFLCSILVYVSSGVVLCAHHLHSHINSYLAQRQWSDKNATISVQIVACYSKRHEWF